MDTSQIKEHIKNSAFNKQYYSVTTSVKRALSGLFPYTHRDEIEDNNINETDLLIDRIFEAVPDFQRNNDKWSTKMQISFIENVICGYKTEIMLFEIGDTIMSRCQILDGLQRITAFYEFLSGNIKAFGKTYEELKSSNLVIFAIV